MGETTSLAVQIAELKRERRLRDRVYSYWVKIGKMRQDDADYRNGALDAAISTLERLERGEAIPKEKLL